MRFLTFLIFVSPLFSLAADWSGQEDYNTCIRTGFFEQNSGPQSCDFSNIRINTPSILRTCNMAMVHNLDLGQTNLSDFTTQLKKAEGQALATLSRELSDQLHKCGYMGEIEITSRGGQASFHKFLANPEICEELTNVMTANDREYAEASVERQGELRNQKLLLNSIFQISGCIYLSPSEGS